MVFAIASMILGWTYKGHAAFDHDPEEELIRFTMYRNKVKFFNSGMQFDCNDTLVTFKLWIKAIGQLCRR